MKSDQLYIVAFDRHAEHVKGKRELCSHGNCIILPEEKYTFATEMKFAYFGQDFTHNVPLVEIAYQGKGKIDVVISNWDFLFAYEQMKAWFTDPFRPYDPVPVRPA